MKFVQRLKSAWSSGQTLLCVGLDPDPAKLPKHLAAEKYPLFEFGRAIVDATADLVCAFKPQIAYYAAARSSAGRTLSWSCRSAARRRSALWR